MILIMTARNAYDLLPTIRSRAVQMQFGRLSDEEMGAFAQARGLNHADRRLPLARGCPGFAIDLDIETYDRRRAAMLKLLEVGARSAPFSDWAKHSEYISARKTEKLDYYIDVLYILLEDLLLVKHRGDDLRNPDLRKELEVLASQVPFEWIRTAVAKADELVALLRRNIQKAIALDAFALELRSV